MSNGWMESVLEPTPLINSGACVSENTQVVLTPEIKVESLLPAIGWKQHYISKYQLNPSFLIFCIIGLIFLMILLIIGSYWILKRCDKNKSDKKFFKRCTYCAIFIIFIVIIFLLYMIFNK